MLYGANVAICSEINTQHANTLWQNVKNLNVKLLLLHITSRL
jgi:hypothetical protein